MRNLKSIWAVAGTTVLALGAGAALAGERLSYTNAQLDWSTSEFDDLNVDGDGLALSGSYAIADRVHLYGRFTDEDYDFDIGLSTLEIGAGYRWPLATRLDLIGRLSFVRADIDSPIGGADDNGYGVGAALRARLGPQFELQGSLDYVDLGDGADGSTLGVEGRYFFTEAFSLGLSGRFDEDLTTFGVGVRFDF